MTEFWLIPLLLIRRYVPLAVLAGISYHTGLVLITGGSTFNTFWFSLVATYIALFDWPSGLLARYNPEKRSHRLAHSVLAPSDADRLVTWYPAEIARLELTSDTAAYTGIAAGARLLMYSPVCYISCAIIFNLTAFHYHSMIIPFVVYGLILAVGFGYVGRIRVTRAPAGRHAHQRW